jgi:carbamoyl-phosphate synthase large subunit
MEVGFDKLYTANFLEEHGLPFPKTKIVSEVDETVFPLILKDRKGSGSKSIFLVSEQSEFDFYARRFPNFIAQEFVPNSSEEYTCGLFRSSTGEIRSITFKRKLIGGFSGFGMVVCNDSIDEVLIAIAEKLDLLGSINVQLRLSDRGPIVFEINPRFSSTVMFRHLMGFEDVIWSIQDRLSLPISHYQKPEAGRRFYKGFSEYID